MSTSAPTSALMTTYAPQPVAFERGEGVWLYDTEGRRYLDALSGIAVNTLGHNHPVLTPALQKQVATLIHHSNLFQAPLQEQLAAKLCELSGMDRVFFCCTGLEANEAALKIARLYGYNKGVVNPETVVFEKAFHGRSIATLSATGNSKVQKGFEPLVPGFVRVPLNDIAALEQVAQNNPKVVAVFFEAIQGEGGINPASIEYLRAARVLCDRMGWLLMIDEVQCGMGRTGKWFAHQWAGIVPDVMPLAKGLGSGVPIGAVVAKGIAAETFKPGNHGTTFGGNPLAMRAALTTIEIMEKDGLMANAAAMGSWIKDALTERLKQHKGFVEIRGSGLMLGIQLDRPCGSIVPAALKAGLVLNVTADSVVRLLPPLIYKQEHAQLLVDTLVPLIEQVIAEPLSSVEQPAAKTPAIAKAA
jgi:acetylornithine/N-succinyldiaminopimelate aminotransferase